VYLFSQLCHVIYWTAPQLPCGGFHWAVVGIVVANMATNWLVEAALSTGSWVKRVSHALSGKTQPKNRYKLISRQLESDSPDWPTSGQTYYSQGYT